MNQHLSILPGRPITKSQASGWWSCCEKARLFLADPVLPRTALANVEPTPYPLLRHRAVDTFQSSLHAQLVRSPQPLPEGVVDEMWAAAWRRSGADEPPDQQTLEEVIRPYAADLPFFRGGRLLASQWTLGASYLQRRWETRVDAILGAIDGALEALEITGRQNAFGDVRALTVNAAITQLCLRESPSLPIQLRQREHRVTVGSMARYTAALRNSDATIETAVDITLPWEQVEWTLQALDAFLVDVVASPDMYAPSPSIQLCAECRYGRAGACQWGWVPNNGPTSDEFGRSGGAVLPRETAEVRMELMGEEPDSDDGRSA